MSPLNAGALADMIRRHQLERLRTEIGLAIERTAIDQHLREARKLVHLRAHAAAGGLPLLANLGPALAPDTEITVVRNRLGEQFQPIRVGYAQDGIAHS